MSDRLTIESPATEPGDLRQLAALTRRPRGSTIWRLLTAPLQRLTPLSDDPAAGWLSGPARFAVTLKGWAAWAAFFLLLFAMRLCVRYVMDTLIGIEIPRVPSLVSGATGAAFLIPMRRAVVALKAQAIVTKARAVASSQARALDDLRTLAGEPDGSVVSLVGWVRGHSYLSQPVTGLQAVGLTLRCQDERALMLEILQNFDLVGEAGDEALVVTEGGRLSGKTNVRLSRASHDDKMFVTSLDLPTGAVLTDWNAFVVRDGDPVMVLGTKTTVQDLSGLARGGPVTRVAVASAPARPLLVFPLDAERRDV
jgi:hypothetical protein